MCVRTIVDTNVLSDLRGGNDALQQGVHRPSAWIRRRDGLIVSTDGGRFADEINKVGRIKELYARWEKNRLLLMIPYEVVQEVERTLDLGTIQSDDPHVLGLALAGEAVVLHSDDKNLHHDFKSLGAVHGVARSVYSYRATSVHRNRFLRSRKCTRC